MTEQNMRVLVACEESQRVCTEFRRLGHEAYSCDLEPCSGGHPEWHIQGDVLGIINGHLSFCGHDVYRAPFPIFRTQDGKYHDLPKRWDMVIAFPPCTHLAASGARYFKEKQKDGRQKQGMDFFMRFVNADCRKIAIENPVGIMSNVYRKPDQIIQPWMFGDNAAKRTCLWLKGLECLVPDVKEMPELEYVTYGNGRKMQKWMYEIRCKTIKNGYRAKMASKTFPGIAVAMAEQWGRENYQTGGKAMDYEQLDIFSFIQPQKKGFKPGDWVEKDAAGKRLTFDEITKEVGNLIVMDQSTSGHEWYKVVLVEKIVMVEENQRRLIYYDGKKQRGLVNEMWFNENMDYPARAWRLASQN